MDIFIIENRDVEDNYMAIEGIFSEEQVANEESKLIGEPFWHEIVVSKHELGYVSSYVYIVQKDNELAYSVFSSERKAKKFADTIGLDYSNITRYKVNHI